METPLVAESLHYYTSDFLLFSSRHFSLSRGIKGERHQRSRRESRRYSTLISVCYPLIWGLYNKIEGSDKVIYPGSELSEARMSPLCTPVVVQR